MVGETLGEKLHGGLEGLVLGGSSQDLYVVSNPYLQVI